jgi:hypothetical protein
MNESRTRPESKIGRVRTALMYLIEQHRRDGALPTSVRFLNRWLANSTGDASP